MFTGHFPWFCLAESHLTRRLFGALVRRIEVQSLPAAQQELCKQTNRSEKRQAPERCLETSAALAADSVSWVIGRQGVPF